MVETFKPEITQDGKIHSKQRMHKKALENGETWNDRAGFRYLRMKTLKKSKKTLMFNMRAKRKNSPGHYKWLSKNVMNKDHKVTYLLIAFSRS